MVFAHYNKIFLIRMNLIRKYILVFFIFIIIPTSVGIGLKPFDFQLVTRDKMEINPFNGNSKVKKTDLTQSITKYSQHIAINEILASSANDTLFNKKNYDWIEIYNYGLQYVNIKNFALSDDINKLDKWKFPDTILMPHEFLIVFASGKDKIDKKGNIHSNFKIDKSGDMIILSNNEGKILDLYNGQRYATNISVGRFPNGRGRWLYYEKTTPKERNKYNGALGLIDEPNFSHESGFYGNDFYLKVSYLDTNVKIRYTIDGSEPNENSPIFPDSLLVYDRKNDRNVFSAINTTPNIDLWCKWKPPVDVVEKCTNIRIKGFKTYCLSPFVTTKSYFVKKKYSIPVISLSIDTSYLYGQDGIYENFDRRGREWEKKAHIDFFENNGEFGFASNVGVRLQGANSRKYAQKSYRIYFRKEYGKSELKYKIFPNLEVKKFKRLILRNAGSDWDKTFFRDAFAQSILQGFSDLPTQAYRLCVVYINGEYAGIMNIREFYDENYFKEHYDAKKIDLIKEPKQRVVEGDSVHFSEMQEFVLENDLTIDANFEHFCNLVDIENYIDFQIMQIFSMNTDQPAKNVFYWRPRTENGKWQWVLYDMDDSFRFGKHNNYQRDGLVYCTGLNNIESTEVNEASTNPFWANNTPENTFMLRSLLKNKEFKTKFINRFADLLNTAFTPEYLTQKLDAFYYKVKEFIPQQYSRWRQPIPENFKMHYQLIKTFVQNRQSVQFQHLADFFNITETVNVTLDVNNSEFGYIKINSLNLNDSLPCFSETPYPWNGKYFVGIPITIEAIPKDGYFFEKWEGNFENSNSVLEITPTENLYLKAVFVEK